MTRLMALAFVCAFVSGCGGGGSGGGSSDGGASGGTSSGGSNGVTPSLSVSPSVVTLTSIPGGTATIDVHVDYVGNGVNASFAPGVQAPSWLLINSLSSSGSRASFTLTASGLPASGTYSTTVRFSTSRPDGSGARTFDLPVTYVVQAGTHQPAFVSPYIGVENVAGTFILRGAGFASSPVIVHIGEHAVGPYLPDSETQVTVQYPPLPEGRYPVSVQPAEGLNQLSAEFIVRARQTFAYQAIEAPAVRSRLVYDAERLLLLAVNKVDAKLEAYEYSGSRWTARPSLTISGLTDAVLSPDGKTLILLAGREIKRLDLDGAWEVTTALSVPDLPCDTYFGSAAMMNNGVAFIVPGCSTGGLARLYDLKSNSLAEISNHRKSLLGPQLLHGTAAASADGSKVFIGDRGLLPNRWVSIYDALTDSMYDASVGYDLTTLSASGNADRVIVNDQLVHDGRLKLIGRLPTLRLGSAIASHDSRSAYVYHHGGGQPRILIYDISQPLTPVDEYPEIQQIDLTDTPYSIRGGYESISMVASPDDATLFVSGDARILVVPIPKR